MLLCALAVSMDLEYPHLVPVSNVAPDVRYVPRIPVLSAIMMHTSLVLMGSLATHSALLTLRQYLKVASPVARVMTDIFPIQKQNCVLKSPKSAL